MPISLPSPGECASIVIAFALFKILVIPQPNLWGSWETEGKLHCTSQAPGPAMPATLAHTNVWDLPVSVLWVFLFLNPKGSGQLPKLGKPCVLYSYTFNNTESKEKYK